MIITTNNNYCHQLHDVKLHKIMNYKIIKLNNLMIEFKNRKLKITRLYIYYKNKCIFEM